MATLRLRVLGPSQTMAAKWLAGDKTLPFEKGKFYFAGSLQWDSKAKFFDDGSVLSQHGEVLQDATT